MLIFLICKFINFLNLIFFLIFLIFQFLIIFFSILKFRNFKINLLLKNFNNFLQFLEQFLIHWLMYLFSEKPSQGSQMSLKSFKSLNFEIFPKMSWNFANCPWILKVVLNVLEFFFVREKKEKTLISLYNRQTNA